MTCFNTPVYRKKSQKLLELGALTKIIPQVTKTVMYISIQHILLENVLYFEYGGRSKDPGHIWIMRKLWDSRVERHKDITKLEGECDLHHEDNTSKINYRIWEKKQSLELRFSFFLVYLYSY